MWGWRRSGFYLKCDAKPPRVLARPGSWGVLGVGSSVAWAEGGLHSLTISDRPWAAQAHLPPEVRGTPYPLCAVTKNQLPSSQKPKQPAVLPEESCSFSRAANKHSGGQVGCVGFVLVNQALGALPHPAGVPGLSWLEQGRALPFLIPSPESHPR